MVRSQTSCKEPNILTTARGEKKRSPLFFESSILWFLTSHAVCSWLAENSILPERSRSSIAAGALYPQYRYTHRLRIGEKFACKPTNEWGRAVVSSRAHRKEGARLMQLGPFKANISELNSFMVPPPNALNDIIGCPALEEKRHQLKRNGLRWDRMEVSTIANQITTGGGGGRRGKATAREGEWVPVAMAMRGEGGVFAATHQWRGGAGRVRRGRVVLRVGEEEGVSVRSGSLRFGGGGPTHPEFIPTPPH